MAQKHIGRSIIFLFHRIFSIFTNYFCTVHVHSLRGRCPERRRPERRGNNVWWTASRKQNPNFLQNWRPIECALRGYDDGTKNWISLARNSQTRVVNTFDSRVNTSWLLCKKKHDTSSQVVTYINKNKRNSKCLSEISFIWKKKLENCPFRED